MAMNQMNKEADFHKVLEQDLQRLAKEIREKRKSPEFQKLPERELVKESLKAFAGTPTPSVKISVSPSTPQPKEKTPVSPSPFLPQYFQKTEIPPEIQFKVEKLLDFTLHQGLLKGIKEAQNQPPFIEDAYHDALVDKILPELKRRGMLK